MNIDIYYPALLTWRKKIQFGGRFNDLVRVEFPAVELEELFDKKNDGTNEIRFKKRLVAI